MVGITQTSDGRWRRVDDARGIERFGSLAAWSEDFPWRAPSRLRN